MSVYTEIFQPFISLFTQSQVQTILLAWLPTKLESYLSGIMAVDMFITSVFAYGISALAFTLFTLFGSNIIKGSWRNRRTVTAQIEHNIIGPYGIPNVNPLYESLSWLISQQTKSLENGSFIVQLTTNFMISDNEKDEYSPPEFNILPEKDQEISIEFKGKRFKVEFNVPNLHGPNNMFDDDSNTNVDSITEFLYEVTRAHKEDQKKMKGRSRYERNDCGWEYVQTLSSIRGLDTVALDEPLELLLSKELETFVNDKSFYERIGMPYRRGILLYGKPGTGKTSLVNAISSQLSRDIYYLNLKNIKDDNDLSAAFSGVPPNNLIVLEDVDTQSKVLHKRTENSSNSDSDKKSKSEEKLRFSLSTFLGYLDGHVLAEGNIIIMTTNHVEFLDPACIRPGRMDVHLELGYCTHYQIKKMFKSVVENPEVEFPQDILEKIPERLLPPCEAMMTMVLYRNEIDQIPQKIYELVTKYVNMKPEDIAKQMEEEMLRIEEASANLDDHSTNRRVDEDSDTDVDFDYRKNNIKNMRNFKNAKNGKTFDKFFAIVP
ncbi:16292_t:CDS:2 [Funneliformis geosporum]|nr:16292_t:CDS:2 [Funneliformis geosporum]